MLIIALVKGVPARTTSIAQVGGVLNREAMDIVLNPHDAKTIEAADFVKRRVGGKTVALSMGPDLKLVPIMKPLYEAEAHGVDEECVLSDRKMAGSDTLATSYAVSLGVKKVLDRHIAPIDEVEAAVRQFGYSDAAKARAVELYRGNLLSNAVYSELPSVKGSILSDFLEGKASADETIAKLEEQKELLRQFIVVAGIKSTDGETGSVGPQVAEALSELLGVQLPHATYVEDFDVEPETMTVESERKIGLLSQKLEMRLPCVLTVSTEYRPRGPVASGQIGERMNNYRGKTPQPLKWSADDLGADPARLGFAGSPTIVGPGIDLGKPPVQKRVGLSLVFAEKVGEMEVDGKKCGPFDKGDLADGLPEPLLAELRSKGTVAVFDYSILAGELLR